MMVSSYSIRARLSLAQHTFRSGFLYSGQVWLSPISSQGIAEVCHSLHLLRPNLFTQVDADIDREISDGHIDFHSSTYRFHIVISISRSPMGSISMHNKVRSQPRGKFPIPLARLSMHIGSCAMTCIVPWCRIIPGLDIIKPGARYIDLAIDKRGVDVASRQPHLHSWAIARPDYTGRKRVADATAIIKHEL
ncbi:hypothetical protein BCR34DRAFT_389776 [Clohesyomyces aquaticus]|uniref:Uncharacterized protein n=1 Tax=Clohesyomyces aquaticus TaxID=1231657 RepID=A0A1Y1ZEP8_9PLEO|nr:hypothetical protein BCR34DRAFT_389776 [Clohesyomyces aquaticus]